MTYIYIYNMSRATDKRSNNSKDNIDDSIMLFIMTFPLSAKT